MKGRHALLDQIFELTDRCFFEIDMVQNERTLCAYPQCTRTVWRGADGVFSMYCGITHRDAMAKKMAPEMLCIVSAST